jgi:sulfate adenylyltransferase subunit 1
MIATDFSGTTEASQLAINEIGEVNIKLSKAIYFDAYNDNKSKRPSSLESRIIK